MHAAIVESESRSGSEVAHGGGREYLSWLRQLADPRADDRRDPADLARDVFALTGLRSGTDLETQIADTIAHGQRTAHRARWTVECRVEPVARRVLLEATMTLQLLTDDRVMPLDELSPSAVSELRGGGGPANDVG